jgi:hypothetical protein
MSAFACTARTICLGSGHEPGIGAGGRLECQVCGAELCGHCNGTGELPVAVPPIEWRRSELQDDGMTAELAGLVADVFPDKFQGTGWCWHVCAHSATGGRLEVCDCGSADHEDEARDEAASALADAAVGLGLLGR